MDQAQLEIELGAWKNIAIDKQVLLSDVFLALGLDEQSSNDELKTTLKTMINQANNADDQIKSAQTNVDEIKKQLAAMQKELAKAGEMKEQADASQTASRKVLDDAKEAMQEAEEKIKAAKLANANELKKVTLQLKEKQKEIKAIHKILADSPENVVKKLKSLNKEKFDESTLRKQAEADSRTLRKQVKEAEKEKDDLQAIVDKGADLVVKYKEVNLIANELYTAVCDAADKPDDVTAVPELDQDLIELFDSTDSESESE